MIKIRPSASPGLVLFVTTVSAFFTSFAGSSVNVALPPLGEEFHLGGVALNWVVTTFLLASSVFVMPMGKLGDLRGRGRVFLAGVLVYGLGSLASVLAPSAPWLLAARALSGFGAAMVFGTSTAVLVAAFPPDQRGRVIGFNVAMVYFGLSAGPPLGGLVVEAWGWRSLFGVHAALAALVGLLLILRPGVDEKVAQKGGFDLVGSGLFALGLVLLLVGVSALPAWEGIGLSVLGALVLGGFWVFESRTANPILPVDQLTQNRVFAFSNLAALLSYSATFAVSFFLSLSLQAVRGLTPAQAGLLLIVQPVIQAIFSPLTGRLSDRFSPGLLASLGMGLTALGLGALAVLGPETSLTWTVAALVLLGLGFALFSSPNTNAIMGSVERRHLGMASATVSTMRSLGMILSMGLALVLTAVFLGQDGVTAATQGAFVEAQRWAFSLSAVLCVGGIAASLARGRGRGQS